MRHVFACAHLWTRIKCLNNAFFCMPKFDMNLSRLISENLQMSSNKVHQNKYFNGKFPKVFIKTIILKC